MLALRTLLTVVISLAALVAQAADPPKPTAPPEPKGLVPLCNGKDLTGWEGDMRLWSVKDGIIRGETTKEKAAKGNTFLLWKGSRDDLVDDFELRLEFRIRGGNSGVQYRSKHLPFKETDENKWVVAGYQAEVEDTPGKAGFLYHERGRGELCQVGQKVEIGADGKPKVVGTLGDKAAIGATYKKGDWNDYVIIAKGNHLVHYLNGIQTVDVTDNDPKGRLMRGVLALQIHAGPPMVVEFKDVRLKRFEESKP